MKYAVASAVSHRVTIARAQTKVLGCALRKRWLEARTQRRGYRPCHRTFLVTGIDSASKIQKRSQLVIATNNTCPFPCFSYVCFWLFRCVSSLCSFLPSPWVATTCLFFSIGFFFILMFQPLFHSSHQHRLPCLLWSLIFHHPNLAHLFCCKTLGWRMGQCVHCTQTVHATFIDAALSNLWENLTRCVRCQSSSMTAICLGNPRHHLRADWPCCTWCWRRVWVKSWRIGNPTPRCPNIFRRSIICSQLSKIQLNDGWEHIHYRQPAKFLVATGSLATIANGQLNGQKPLTPDANQTTICHSDMDSTKCRVTQFPNFLSPFLIGDLIGDSKNAQSDSMWKFATLCHVFISHNPSTLQIETQKINSMKGLLLETHFRHFNNDHRLCWTRPASSCNHPKLQTHEDHCQLHFHRSRFHWKCLRSHCFQTVHVLQLPRFPFILQAHSLPSFGVWVFRTSTCFLFAHKPPSKIERWPPFQQAEGCTAWQTHEQPLLSSPLSFLLFLQPKTFGDPHHLFQLWFPVTQTLFSNVSVWGQRQWFPLSQMRHDVINVVITFHWQAPKLFSCSLSPRMHMSSPKRTECSTCRHAHCRSWHSEWPSTGPSLPHCAWVCGWQSRPNVNSWATAGFVTCHVLSFIAHFRLHCLPQRQPQLPHQGRIQLHFSTHTQPLCQLALSSLFQENRHTIIQLHFNFYFHPLNNIKFQTVRNVHYIRQCIRF